MNAILFLLFAAAGSVNLFAQPANLKNVQWTLTEAGGREVTSAIAYLQIEDNGRFTGNTGCNRMFGSVELGAQRVDFGAIGSTRRMCKLEPGSVPENVFTNSLERAARYRIAGNLLEMMDRRGRVILRFRRQVKLPPVEDVGLESRKWLLESIGDRKTLVAIKGVFVNFNAEQKSAGGDSGCNVFGGSYAVNGSKISITNLVSTMRACAEGRMTVEREFFDGLREADRFEIRDERLFLYRGPALLLTLRGEMKK